MKAKIIFTECIQNSQKYGNNDEHMVSELIFTIEVEDKHFSNLRTYIKQTVGSKYEEFPLEVGIPENYNGPFNY